MILRKKKKTFSYYILHGFTQRKFYHENLRDIVELFFDTLCAVLLFIYHALFGLRRFSRHPIWKNSSVKLCKMDRFRSFPCFRHAMDRPNIVEEVRRVLRNVTYIQKISSKVTCLYIFPESAENRTKTLSRIPPWEQHQIKLWM